MLFCRTQMLLFSKKLTPSTLLSDKAAFASYYLAMIAKKIIFAAPEKNKALKPYIPEKNVGYHYMIIFVP